MYVLNYRKLLQEIIILHAFYYFREKSVVRFAKLAHFLIFNFEYMNIANFLKIFIRDCRIMKSTIKILNFF